MATLAQWIEVDRVLPESVRRQIFDHIAGIRAMDWTALENRLAQAIGLESSSLGTTVFRQAVGRRMRAREVETLPDVHRSCSILTPSSCRPSSRNWSFERAGSSGMRMPLSFFAGTRHRR